ncbi:MAG: ScyD/ScyE family protein [Synechococcaceae cyanobacterium SM2_3_1]|nr:ScyD/ScyE family protein [Synechococcaceae cyanobacterium SM2_3_1]
MQALKHNLFQVGFGFGLSTLIGACSSSSSPLALPTDPEPGPPTVTVLASNLDSPRGITLGPDQQLYVAEAGRGPAGGFDPNQPTAPSPSVPGAQLQSGTTGAITRIDPETGEVQRVLTNLPSVAIPAGEPVLQPPTGADSLGPTDVAFAPDGQLYFLIGLGTDPANREILNTPELGSLVTADPVASDPNSTVRYLADVAAVEAQTNPDGTDVVSNPYSLLVQEDSVWIIDAGANVLLQSDRNGNDLAVNTVFGEIRFFPNPGIPGAPDPLPMQQVPTAITLGPDGQFYVSELTGLPFPLGEARILSLETSEPTTAFSGFTNLVDIDFDSQGNLWILEYDSDSILGEAPFGSLIRLEPNGVRTTILADLITPTAVTVGPDGEVYVANQGFNAGEGEILKLEF